MRKRVDTVSRQRSVLLSRGALEEARLQRGLYQETIAYRMQEAHPERFPANPPVKLVNRAFNGHRVLVANAQMIADVLGRPLDSLLDTARPAADTPPDGADGERDPAAPPDDPLAAAYHPARRPNAPPVTQEPAASADPVAAPVAQFSRPPLSAGMAALLAALVGVAVLFWFTRPGPERTIDGASPTAVRSPVVTGGAPMKLALVAAPDVPDWIRRLLADEFTRQLQDPLRFTVSLRAPDEIVTLPDLVRQLGADVLLRLDTESVGRHLMLVFTLASETVTERFWLETAPAGELGDFASELVGNTARALYGRLGLTDGITAPRPSGTHERQSMAGYLMARQLLEDSAGSSAATLDRAFRSVQSAIEHDEAFALAWAAKCEVLARLYWVDDTQPYLDEAAATCDGAGRRLPDHPYVIAARARVATRQADADGAMALLAPALERWPTSIALNMAAAEAHYMRYYGHSDPAALEAAMETLRTVTELEPEYWEAHFWLGTFALSSGSGELALAALREAARLNPNELALSNLGTVALCEGDLETAAATYASILERTPASAMANEMLGAVHHFRREYAAEITFRERSLAARSSSEATQIHGIYGGLADAYRLAGQPARALEAYRTAVEVLRRDEIGGVFGPSEHASAAYYAARLAQLERTLAQPAVKREIRERLDHAVAGDLNILSTVHAAQAFALIGDPAGATAYWDRATQRCPVYRRHPDHAAR